MSRWEDYKAHRRESKRMKELLNREEHYLF
jgi:hypothetical protein